MKSLLVRSGIAASLLSFAMLALADPPVGPPTPPGTGPAVGTKPVLVGGGTGSIVPSIGGGGFNIVPSIHCLFMSPTLTIIDHIAGQKVERQIPNPLYTECLARYGH